MNDQEIDNITSLCATCDQGEALHRLLDLIIEANLGDHIDIVDMSNEQFTAIQEAKTVLYRLARARAQKEKARLDAI